MQYWPALAPRDLARDTQACIYIRDERTPSFSSLLSLALDSCI